MRGDKETTMGYPQVRMRRLRRNATLRRMVRETSVSPDDLIMPLFVRPGSGVRSEIASMPSNYQLSPDTLVEEAKAIEAAGVPAIILFGIPDHKDAVGSAAYADGAVVCRGVEAVKKACPSLCVITDVCMCEYTDHGHCGNVMPNRDGVPDVDNDSTLELLVKEALAHARAGADMVAPSDMMDGRVGAIRIALDGTGFEDVPIMAYSAKYASAFYGPFRDAAESPPLFGDRNSYQMDPANAKEAMREIELDIEEGADIVMVKPALPYLDIIRMAADQFDAPIAAYQVSGEFAMVKAAAANGWIDEKRAAVETLTAIRRAGAKLILTYWAKEAAQWLR
jgi:porphobilinogen synthase